MLDQPLKQQLELTPSERSGRCSDRLVNPVPSRPVPTTKPYDQPARPGPLSPPFLAEIGHFNEIEDSERARTRVTLEQAA